MAVAIRAGVGVGAGATGLQGKRQSENLDSIFDGEERGSRRGGRPAEAPSNRCKWRVGVQCRCDVVVVRGDLSRPSEVASYGRDRLHAPISRMRDFFDRLRYVANGLWQI